MFTSIFESGVFDSNVMQLSYIEGMACLLTAVILGVLIALTAKHCGSHTQGMLFSLVFLPAIVSIVIIMVNGNLGTGVAIAGAFSLVRFRSVPGRAMDICMIFLAMAMGLAVGIGYLLFAAFATVFLCLVIVILYKCNFGGHGTAVKIWNITVPENLSYTTAFEEVFAAHKASVKLVAVKTANMGSLYHLTYEIGEMDIEEEKAMLDDIRCRNANLPISVSAAGEPVDIL